jgi:hypothetical protein
MRTAPPKRDKPRTTKSQTRRARGLVGAAQHFWRQDHHLQELAPEYSAHLTDQSVEQMARGEDSLSPRRRRSILMGFDHEGKIAGLGLLNVAGD